MGENPVVTEAGLHEACFLWCETSVPAPSLFNPVETFRSIPA
jgi:hypothetical protein